MSLRPLAVLALLVLPMLAAAQSPIPDDAAPELIATGFQFTEGPVWMDGTLLFSDIPANTIYQWTPDGGTAVFRSPSQKSNGLLLDREGRLLLAQHAAQRVARLDDGTEVALATEYDGKTFNSPNDLAVHPDDGSIYFTDPTWGLEGRTPELGFMGVYRLDPQGTVHLLVDDLDQPNGIAFSPDLSTLYVTETVRKTVMAYDLTDHEVSNGRVLARLATGSASADGMTVDAEGNLYVAGSTGSGSTSGIVVLAPDGTRLDAVTVDGSTTNVAWGDADGQTLYITSGPGVYRLRVGSSTATEGEPSAQFDLVTISPNPTSGAARIVYRLASPRPVTVTLLDVLGRGVQRLDAGLQLEGEHTLPLDLDGLPAGVYVVQLSAGEHTRTRSITVAR